MMKVQRANSRISSPIYPDLPGRALIAVAQTLVRMSAFLLFSVLAMLEPLVRLALTLLAVIGFLTCGIYRFLLKDPGFPFWSLLLFSMSMCVLWGLYALLLRGLSRA